MQYMNCGLLYDGEWSQGVWHGRGRLAVPVKTTTLESSVTACFVVSAFVRGRTDLSMKEDGKIASDGARVHSATQQVMFWKGLG